MDSLYMSYINKKWEHDSSRPMRTDEFIEYYVLHKKAYIGLIYFWFRTTRLLPDVVYSIETISNDWNTIIKSLEESKNALS